MSSHLNTIVLFLIFFLLSACSSKVVKNKNQIVIGIGSIPASLDPRFALDSEGMKIGGLLFQSLVKIGPNMEVVGDLALSWRIEKLNQDRLHRIDFELNPESKFNTGHKVTCDDVLFSITEYQSEASPFKTAFSSIKKSICKNHKLSLDIENYSEKILNSDLPVIKILPKSIVQKLNLNFKDQLVGSGPYFVAKNTESEILLIKNIHSSSKSQIPKLLFKVIKDDFTRFLKMYKGDLDLAISTLPKNKIFALSKLENLEIIKKPGLNMVYLLLNFKNPVLQKFENRKLIYNAINRTEIIKYKLEGLAQPATSLLTPTNPYFWNGFLNYIKPDFNTDELKSKVSNEMLNTTFRFKTSNTREAVENAKLISSQLRSIGLKVQHQSYEWGTYYKDIKNGDYDLATMTWVGAYDPDIYRIAFSSKELPPEGRNRGYYKNESLDLLLEAGAKELDSEKRKEIYYKIQRLIFNELVIIPLWYEDTITVLDRRIKNYTPSLNGDYSGLLSATLN